MHREVSANRSRDPAQIIWIAGHDQIPAVKRGDHDRGVDQITSAARGKRRTGHARLLLGERLDVTAMYQSRQPRLGAAAPGLAQHNRRKRRPHPTTQQVAM
jgi:hypothetical protein